MTIGQFSLDQEKIKQIRKKESEILQEELNAVKNLNEALKKNLEKIKKEQDNNIL